RVAGRSVCRAGGLGRCPVAGSCIINLVGPPVWAVAPVYGSRGPEARWARPERRIAPFPQSPLRPRPTSPSAQHNPLPGRWPRGAAQGARPGAPVVERTVRVGDSPTPAPPAHQLRRPLQRDGLPPDLPREPARAPADP